MLKRKLVLGAVSVAGIIGLTAGPAAAHYCYKTDFNDEAAEKVAQTDPWMTPEEWITLVGMFLESDGVPQPAIECVQGELAEQYDEDDRIMGPGLLAGGTEGTDRTPDGIAYTDFGAAAGACGLTPPAE
jgi:hypothetical protein